MTKNKINQPKEIKEIIDYLFPDSQESYIYPRKLIHAIGISETLTLTILIGISRKSNEDWFAVPVEYMEEVAQLSKYQQKELFLKLKNLGFIDIQNKGLFNKRYIKINHHKIAQYIITITT